MLFIAEVGLNYNGNFALAYELIRQAKLAGADIAKFQLGWRDKEGEINHIDLASLKRLKEWCDYFGIEFTVSIITDAAFDMARQIDFKRYKIASRTVKEKPDLVRRIVKEGKETIISLGMWDKDKPPLKKDKKIRYLWCRSRYPVEPKDLVGMPKDFKVSIYNGYSDHSIGIDAPLIAISRGARIIEKHITLDKSDTTIRDHVLSATPSEFRLMVDIGREIARKVSIGV